MKVIRLLLNIHVGDFIELFPQYLLDSVRDLKIYEIDIDYNGKSLLYFGDIKELKKLKNILYSVGIIDMEEDVTNLFNTNMLGLNDIEIQFLNEFLLDNISINDILDKINIYGISSLNKLDKHILDGSK
jgi:hypothetical protein